VTRVLAFGKSPATVERGLSLLRHEGLEADGATTAIAAIAYLDEAPVDIVVIGGGVGKDERAAVLSPAARLPHPPKILEIRGVRNLMSALRQHLTTGHQ
jgi:hypothetical protein